MQVLYNIFRGEINIGDLNVRGLGDYHKRKAIFNFLKKNKLDIVFLQETHVNSIDTAKLWDSEWGTKTYHSYGTTKSAGVAILINKTLKCEISNVSGDTEGRIISLCVNLDGRKIALTNIYAPNTDEVEFFEKVINYNEKLADCDGCVMGGDFNLVLDPSIDRYNSLMNHDRSATCLKEYIEQADLCDIWRIRNPTNKRFTWHRPTSGSASRIDMLLISSLFNDVTSSCDIVPAIRTDHSLLNVEIDLEDYKRGPGIWKLNNQILEEELYQHGIINTIKDSLNVNKFSEPDDIWCALKNDCISFSKKYAILRAKKGKELQTNLLSNK